MIVGKMISQIFLDAVTKYMMETLFNFLTF